MQRDAPASRVANRRTRAGRHYARASGGLEDLAKGSGTRALASVALALAPSGAAAAPPALDVPSLGHFRSVLAQGEGQIGQRRGPRGLSRRPGSRPTASSTSSRSTSGIMPRAGSLTPGRPRHLLQGHGLRLDARRDGGRRRRRGRASTSTATAQLRHGAHLRRQPLRRDVRGRLRDRRGAAVPDGRDPAHRQGHARRAPRARAPPPTTPQQLTDQDFSDAGADRSSSTPAGALRRRRAAQRTTTSSPTSTASTRGSTRTRPNPTEMPAEYPALGATPRSRGPSPTPRRWRCCSSPSSRSPTAARR